jgi:hypothetical protein
MPIEIVPYEEKHIDAVKEFNQRLFNKNINYKFPESNVPKWLPETKGTDIFQKYFLAVDENKIVRGAYILKYQYFYFHGKRIMGVCLQLPLSEGIAEKKYSMLGVRLILDSLEREPNLYALGIGSYEESYSRILMNLKWENHPIPFYFKIINTNRFFRNISYLRNKKYLKYLVELARCSVIPGLLIKMYQIIHEKRAGTDNLSLEQVERFDQWADNIWDNNKNVYSMIAERNSSILESLYPTDNPRFIKIKVSRSGGGIIGWVVLLRTQLKNHKQFGDMIAGTIVDHFSKKGDEKNIIYCAVKYLLNKKVDIIVANQSEINWCHAFSDNGFLKGPSNYIFFSSKNIADYIGNFQENKEHIFFNRGDGDGPITL